MVQAWSNKQASVREIVESDIPSLFQVRVATRENTIPERRGSRFFLFGIGRGERMDSRLCRSALRAALRASVVALLLGVNRTHSAPKHSVGTASQLGGPLPVEPAIW